ncbi:MAG: thermonuclease family protein [Propylenella sp.]
MMLFIAGALGGAVAAEAGCLDAVTEVRAAAVPDARSLTIDDGRVLRVAGIEPFDLLRPDLAAAESALEERLAELVADTPLSVQLIAEKADRYGRIPAMIAAGGTLLQEALAREGLAIAFASGDPLPCFDRILAAEETARGEDRGFWAGASVPNAFPAALAARIGSFALFEGRILSVGNRGARTYLNFGRRWADDVTVEIEARDRGRFGGEAGLSAHAGKRVRVRGFLEAKAGPMMAIRSPMQLELLSADTDEREGAP